MWSQVCDAALLPLLNTAHSKQQNGDWIAVILTIVLSIGIVALAGPSWQKQDYPLLESAAARVLVLDLSQSMLIEDIKPDRMTRVLDVSRQIISSNFDGETALVVFAGAAFVVSPLTRDAGTLLEFTHALSPGTMPLEGNRLDLALNKATRLLAASISKTGQIMVITDGSSHFKLALESATEASRLGNRVSVLVVGNLLGGPMKSADGGLKRNSTGQFILSKPNFEQLEAISRAGRGRFIKLSQFGHSIDSVLQEVRTAADLKTQDREENSRRQAENGGFWLSWLMLPLTLLLFRKNTFWLLLVAMVMPADRELYAMEFTGLWSNREQRAFEAYQNGYYEQARKLTEDAYLSGVIRFKTQNYAAAKEEFSKLHSTRSIYGRGNALAFQGKLEQALQAYQQVLKLEPEFEDARYNQALIEQYLNKQSESNSDVSEAGNPDNDPEEPQSENASQSRSGQVNEIIDFRDQSSQTGMGASPPLNPSDFNEDENISDADIRLEQFLLRIQAEDFSPDPQTVKRWTESLYADPAELFKRKFLRDYLRSKQQQR